MSTVSLSGLSFAPVDPSDEDAIRQWYELCCAVTAADQPDDPAVRFAAASGAAPALVQTRRRLDINTVDPAVLARLDAHAQARSGDYSLVQWVGATPPQWLDDIAYLTVRMSTDAPLDDLQWEQETYDAARIQARDTCWLGRGQHNVTTAAMDRTGRLVAFTHIGADTPRAGSPGRVTPSSRPSTVVTGWVR